MKGFIYFPDMKKNSLYLILAVCALSLCGGCKKQEPLPADSDASESVIPLTVWSGEEDEALLKEICSSFQSHYAGQVSFQITFQPQSESGCKDALLADLEGGADVFTFADDQLAALAAAGALDPLENPEEIRASNLPASVEAASVGDTLYAFPLTADNGYFLYYNKAYFSEDDIQSMNRMTEIAAEQGRLLTMDWSSAWYVYSFFGNTGLTVGLNDDGITNYCTWNQTDGEIKGTDVARAMLRIAASGGFESRTDEGFLEGVKDGTVIAGVSGVWNAVAIEEAWGEDAGAVKLPTYTCDGRQVQMASFSGCKLIGVNAYSEHPVWASRLAEWITSEDNQRLRFELRGQGPADLAVAGSKEIEESPAIAALLEQSESAQLQRVGGKFWDPVTAFAENMAAGNPSGEDLQEQLDKMTEGICER